MAKQISSGYAPIAAVGASDKVAEAFVGGKKEAFVGGSTWGAHPVSCAVALANLDILERERLPENSAATGAYLGEQLAALKSKHKIVAETRGIGLMHSVDLKRNPETGEEFTDADELPRRFTRQLLDAGILSRAGTSVQVAPPLVINREEVDSLVDGLSQAIGGIEEELGIG